uniref:Uncharacterized protein n=1 Tax=Glossina austeni TaxID=7395 RepID=A0A1A9VM77_GLOAU
MLISEQYQGIVSNGAWIADMTNKTTLWICGKKIMQIAPVNKKQCYVGAKVMGIYICYLPPSLKLLVPKADMHSRAIGVCLVIHAVMPGSLPAPLLPLHALYIKCIDVSVTVTILTQGN